MLYQNRKSIMTLWLLFYQILSVLIIFLLFTKNDAKITQSKSYLSSVLKHYERITLRKVDTTFLESENLTGIASGSAPTIHLQFTGYGRRFLISLRPAENIHTDDATVEIQDGEFTQIIPANDIHTNPVEGFLADEPGSSVFGHVLGGYFDGVIFTNEGRYYVEPASRFFKDSANNEVIIYKDSDLIMTPKQSLQNNTQYGHKFCPPHIYPDSDTPLSVLDKRFRGPKWHKYRHKNPVCKMKIVADHTMYKLYGNNIKNTKSVLEQLVKEADNIFSKTDFNFDRKPDNIRVRIDHVLIYKTNIATNYFLGDEEQQVEKYLKLFSYADHSRYCAAMAVTNIHFHDRVVGFAYKGGSGRAGGICYRRVFVEGRLQSTNTGVTSFNSDNGIMPIAKTSIVFTHELGHSFGSSHDTKDGKCFHAEPENQFIMSEEANPGKHLRNRLFSECSKKDIKKNIETNGWCLYCRSYQCSGSSSQYKNRNSIEVRSLMLLYHVMLLVFQKFG